MALKAPEEAQTPEPPQKRLRAARTEVTTLSYERLLRGEDVTEEIEKAFGVDGLGILAVAGVPDLEAKRAALLPLSWKIANLPDEVKETYALPECFYSFGWSHGKERLQGKPDLSKGSWYNNPVHNEPFGDNPELVKKYPSYASKNVWPTEVPELEASFMGLGQLVTEVGKLVAKQCDALVKRKCPAFKDNKLFECIQNSRNHKARLLHYFPSDAPASGDFSDWCGWHNDHGSLTGLVPAQYTDATGKVVPCPDSDAGLYITSRDGVVVKASAPENHLIFQIGEAAQVHSGGWLQATPHAVRGCANAPTTSRETFAVFMQPAFDELMDIPEGVDPAACQSTKAAESLPAGVHALSEKWGSDACPFTTCNFGTFTNETIRLIH